MELIKVGDRFTICCLIGFLKDVFESLKRKSHAKLSPDDQKKSQVTNKTRRNRKQRSPSKAKKDKSTLERKHATNLRRSKTPKSPKPRQSDGKSLMPTENGKCTPRSRSLQIDKKTKRRNRRSLSRRTQGRSHCPRVSSLPPTPTTKGLSLGALYDPEYSGKLAHVHHLRQQSQRECEKYVPRTIQSSMQASERGYGKQESHGVEGGKHTTRRIRSTQEGNLTSPVPPSVVSSLRKVTPSSPEEKKYLAQGLNQYPLQSQTCDFLSDWLSQLNVFGGIPIKDICLAMDEANPHRPEAKETPERWAGHFGQLACDGVLLSQLTALLASISGYNRQTKNVSVASLKRYIQQKSYWNYLKNKIECSSLCEMILLQRTKLLPGQKKHAVVLRVWEQNIVDCFETLKSLTGISGNKVKIRHMDDNAVKRLLKADNRIAWEVLLDVMQALASYSQKDSFTTYFAPNYHASPKKSTPCPQKNSPQKIEPHQIAVHLEPLFKPLSEDYTPPLKDTFPISTSKTYVSNWLRALDFNPEEVIRYLEDYKMSQFLLNNRCFSGEMMAALMLRISRKAVSNIPPGVRNSVEGYLLPTASTPSHLSARTIGEACEYLNKKVSYFRHPKNIGMARANVGFAIRRTRELLLFSKTFYASTEFPVCGFSPKASEELEGVTPALGESILRGNSNAVWTFIVTVARIWTLSATEFIEDHKGNRNNEDVLPASNLDEDSLVKLTDWLSDLLGEDYDSTQPYDVLFHLVENPQILEKCLQESFEKLKVGRSSHYESSSQFKFSMTVKISTMINQALNDGILTRKERDILHETSIRFVQEPSLNSLCTVLPVLFKIVNGFSVKNVARSTGAIEDQKNSWNESSNDIALRHFSANPSHQQLVDESRQRSSPKNARPPPAPQHVDKKENIVRVISDPFISPAENVDTAESLQENEDGRDDGLTQWEDLPLDMNAISELQRWLKKNGIATDKWPYTIPQQFCDGLLLAHIVESCERRKGGIGGINKTPRTTAARLQNIRRVLEVLKDNKRMPLDYLWSENEIAEGNMTVIIKLLEQIRNAYAYHFTPKPLAKSGNATGNMH